MSARREKYKRLHDRALKAERANICLTEMLLLHEPPLRCRISRQLLGESPSAKLRCNLGRCNRPDRCRTCAANNDRNLYLGFQAGLKRKQYPAILAKEIQRIYEEG